MVSEWYCPICEASYPDNEIHGGKCRYGDYAVNFEANEDIPGFGALQDALREWAELKAAEANMTT